MKINPSVLSWTALTTNIDGTPIQYDLEYEVGLMDANQVVRPLMVIPAQLQTGNDYEAPIDALGLANGTYQIALRTFAKDNPKRVSTWSNPVEFAISEQIPNAPLALAVS